MRKLRKLRDVELLLEMHGHKKGYKVRLVALQGINTARAIQGMLRTKVKEMEWDVRGLDHLDAAVELHEMIAASASLIDEVIHHLEVRAFLDDDDDCAFQVLPVKPSTFIDQSRTERQRAPLSPSDGSASSLVGAAGRGRATLPARNSASTFVDDNVRGRTKLPSSDFASALLGAAGRERVTLTSGDSGSTLVDDTGLGHAKLPSGDFASALLGAAVRGRVTLPSDDSGPTLVDDTGRGRTKFPSSDFASALLGAAGRGRRVALPSGDSGSTLVDATGRGRAPLPVRDAASPLLGATGRGRATLPSGDSGSTLLGAAGRGRTTPPVGKSTSIRVTGRDHSAPRHYRDRVALPGDPSTSRRVGNDNRAIVEPALEAATGGRGQLPLAPAAVDLHADHDMDFATHRLFVSGTALRQHHLGSPSVQLIVHGLGRRIEEVADALLGARFPPAVLLEELRWVKEFLHKVWELRVPAEDFKLL